MDIIELPDYVDDPPNVLFWQADEVAPIALGMVVGMFIGQVLIFSVLGLLLTRFYRKFRDSRPDGYLVHWVYWNTGLSGAWSARSFPNPFIRRFRS